MTDTVAAKNICRKLESQPPKIFELKFLSQEERWGRMPGATPAVAAEEGRQMDPIQPRRASERGTVEPYVGTVQQ